MTPQRETALALLAGGILAGLILAAGSYAVLAFKCRLGERYRAAMGEWAEEAQDEW